MNRRKALLGLSAGTIAATGVTFAQQGIGGSPVGTNLRALLLSGGAVVGSFDIKRFAAIDGQLQAIGTATITDGVKTVMTTVALRVTSLTTTPDPPSCPILHLAIGAIDLNLLGLTITISPITIDIVAVPGPGNLLGNLLCAIANLLNSGPLATILNQLIALLNQLLASL